MHHDPHLPICNFCNHVGAFATFNISLFSINLILFKQDTYNKPVNESIQIIQQIDLEIPVINCLLMTTRRIYHCGKLEGLAFGPQVIEYEKYTYPTADVCKQMVLTKMAAFDTKTIPLEGNTTKTFYTSQGKVQSDGSCQGVTYSRHGITYEGTVEITEVMINIISK